MWLLLDLLTITARRQADQRASKKMPIRAFQPRLIEQVEGRMKPIRPARRNNRTGEPQIVRPDKTRKRCHLNYQRHSISCHRKLFLCHRMNLWVPARFESDFLIIY
jgi:hypothetical protein